MKRIYRQKTYCNKPFLLIEDGQKLGSFHTIAEIHARFPDAVYLESKVKLAPYVPKLKKRVVGKP